MARPAHTPQNRAQATAPTAKQTLEKPQLELVLGRLGSIGRQTFGSTLEQLIKVALGIEPLLVRVEAALRKVESVKEGLVGRIDLRDVGVEV